jgi:hypothetical protein
MKHYCQGPRCHTYNTQSRVRGPKGDKVLRTRFARCDINPESNTRSWWEDYFCDERCLHAWLKDNLNQIMSMKGLRTEPLETPVIVTKETYERESYSGHAYTYTDTTIKLLSEVSNNDIATT